MRLGEIAGLEASGKPLRNVFGEALLDVARHNPKVVVLDGDLGNSTKAELVREAIRAHFGTSEAQTERPVLSPHES